MTVFRTPVLLIMTALISNLHAKNVISKDFLQRFLQEFCTRILSVVLKKRDSVVV